MVKSRYSLTICHLYHRNMNIYGDTGNVRTLEYRLKARNLDARIVQCEVGEALPGEVDIIVAGGGQDSGQLVVEKDLQHKKTTLKKMAEDGVVMLTICGTYQLFGHRFLTADDQEIKGISLLDLETQASPDRLIGNVVAQSSFGELVGFENHSGKTVLSSTQASLAKVIKGAGNNGQTGEEGAMHMNVFGTYLHGPLLPKNPQFADVLLQRALERKYGQAELLPLPDLEEHAAAKIAKARPR